MINIVIPLIDTRNNNLELKYSLRSIEKYLLNFNKIFIIGFKPKWIKNIAHIDYPIAKNCKFKEKNIFDKIIKTLHHIDVSSNICVSNDDIFLLKEYDINNLPNYFKGDLYESMKLTNQGYRKSLNHTRRHLMNNGKPTLDYDVHFPIFYNKKQFIDTFQGIDWNIDYGFVIKSFICNSIGVEGELMTDCKIREKLTYNQIKERLANRDWFSTADHAINDDMIKFLEETYPIKSKYEI